MTASEPVTLHLPTTLYDRLKRRAEDAHRSVEAELLDVVATAVPEDDQLSADLEAALTPLALLDDEALWRAARSRLSTEATAQLAPNVLAAYAFELASHFTDFYEHTSPIVREADERVKAFRTYLVRATVQTMSNVLRVLGFVPLEEISFSWVTPQILLSTA